MMWVDVTRLLVSGTWNGSLHHFPQCPDILFLDRKNKFLCFPSREVRESMLFLKNNNNNNIKKANGTEQMMRLVSSVDIRPDGCRETEQRPCRLGSLSWLLLWLVPFRLSILTCDVCCSNTTLARMECPARNETKALDRPGGHEEILFGQESAHVGYPTDCIFITDSPILGAADPSF